MKRERRILPKMGQVVEVSPFHLAGLAESTVTAEVVYVHPEGRFYVAEWTSKHGAVLREGFME